VHRFPRLLIVCGLIYNVFVTESGRIVSVLEYRHSSEADDAFLCFWKGYDYMSYDCGRAHAILSCFTGHFGFVSCMLIWATFQSRYVCIYVYIWYMYG